MVIVLFTRQYEMLTPHHIEKIKAVSEDVTVVIEENVLDVVSNVDVLVAGKLDREILERAKNLKWVHALAAGVNRLLFPEFVESDIVLTNSSGVHPIPISEHVLGMMLMSSRRLDQAFKAQQDRKWDRPQPAELHGKTLGIIGFGSIGERIGRLGKCFGMHVIGIKRRVGSQSDNTDELYPPDHLDDLLRKSDFVVVSIPLTAETECLITKREFELMKNTAYIVNISRGKIICERDLIEALKAGEIAGACLDVFEEEPLPEESSLWELDNVILTPHYAGSTPEYFNRAVDILCENLKRFISKDPLINVVDKKRGY